MPDRVIRDELLDSARYIGLSSDTARLLFVHLLLVVDDNGNTEASSTFIRRRLLASPLQDPVIAKLLNELVDADLVRMYDIDRKVYLHIPRFRQRLRFHKGKYPPPPIELEDPEIRQIRLEKTDLSQTQVRLKPVLSQTQDVRREEKRREVEELHSGATAPSPASPDGALQVLDFLNQKTGKRYQPVEANLRLIRARLKEASADDLRSVIALKARQWRGTDFAVYLRPATLFNATKFAQYQGELVQEAT